MFSWKGKERPLNDVVNVLCDFIDWCALPAECDSFIRNPTLWSSGKCEFGVTSLQFLVHIIHSEGVCLSTVSDFPFPSLTATYGNILV